MRQGALIGPIIIAIGLIVASISFALVGALLETADGGTELRLDRTEKDIQELQAEAVRLEGELKAVRTEIARLLDEFALLQSRGGVTRQNPMVMPSTEAVVGEHPGTEEMTEEMKLAKARFNKGLTQPNNRVMLEMLGRPREDLSQDCKSPTNERIKNLLETRQIGPIRVTMIRPALDSLERIMTRLQESEPDIYAAVGTAGAICARLVRGSTSSISNHSWGTAIDVKLEGRLDGFADGGTQFGLLILAELFNEEGWYWGATYNREDSMHFEVSVEALQRWAAEGQI